MTKGKDPSQEIGVISMTREGERTHKEEDISGHILEKDPDIIGMIGLSPEIEVPQEIIEEEVLPGTKTGEILVITRVNQERGARKSTKDALPVGVRNA